MTKKLLVLPLITLPLLAQAHMLWLEPGTSGITQAYFGEPEEDKRETRQGPLKNFDGIKAIQNGKTLDPKAEDNHFAFTTEANADVRLSQGRIHKETRVFFDAKTGRQETKAAAPLTLELVPDTAGSSEFTLIFRNQPLPKAAVTLISPQKWTKTLHTDAEGKVKLPTPWPGLYLAEVSHTLEEKGSEGEKNYEKTRYVHSLSFTAQ